MTSFQLASLCLVISLDLTLSWTSSLRLVIKIHCISVGRYSLNRDSGNSSLDSSDPSSSIEWKLSVRSTLGPRQEKKTKPPPPPRRSKSYERPINNNNTSTVNNNNPDIQSNYEEYDLSHMMETSNKVTGGRKKVSFQEEQPGSLRKMPSTPSLTGRKYFAHNKIIFDCVWLLQKTGFD